MAAGFAADFFFFAIALETRGGEAEAEKGAALDHAWGGSLSPPVSRAGAFRTPDALASARSPQRTH